MPELDFRITGVAPVPSSLIPALKFDLAVSNNGENVQAVLLRAQIQILSPNDGSEDGHGETLAEAFDSTDQWLQPVRRRLWTHAHTTLDAFARRTRSSLLMQCTPDLAFAARRYFQAADEGVVPLAFSFSGTVFYAGAAGRLQVHPIPPDTECHYRMPTPVWEMLMREHFPNTSLLHLRQDVFDRLYAYKCRNGLPSWEQTIDHLLPAVGRQTEVGA